MFEISKLKEKKLSELQEIANELKISKYKTLKKLDLVYKILDHQASNPDEKESDKKNSLKPSFDRKNRPNTKRNNDSKSNSCSFFTHRSRRRRNLYDISYVRCDGSTHAYAPSPPAPSPSAPSSMRAGSSKGKSRNSSNSMLPLPSKSMHEKSLLASSSTDGEWRSSPRDDPPFVPVPYMIARYIPHFSEVEDLKGSRGPGLLQ